MRGSVEQTVTDALLWSERRRGGFREHDLGAMGSAARVLSVAAATALRHRKWFLPAGGRCEEVVVMALRP